MDDAQQDRIEVQPPLRQPILVTNRSVAIGHLLQDTFVDQFPEPVGEDMAGDAKAGLELVKFADAQETVSQDQPRSAVADH